MPTGGLSKLDTPALGCFVELPLPRHRPEPWHDPAVRNSASERIMNSARGKKGLLGHRFPDWVRFRSDVMMRAADALIMSPALYLTASRDSPEEQVLGEGRGCVGFWASPLPNPDCHGRDGTGREEKRAKRVASDERDRKAVGPTDSTLNGSCFDNGELEPCVMRER